MSEEPKKIPDEADSAARKTYWYTLCWIIFFRANIAIVLLGGLAAAAEALGRTKSSDPRIVITFAIYLVAASAAGLMAGLRGAAWIVRILIACFVIGLAAAHIFTAIWCYAAFVAAPLALVLLIAPLFKYPEAPAAVKK